MPVQEKWTALPEHLDHLMARMVDVRRYPEYASDGRARCQDSIGSAVIADPHDWRAWMTGKFIASYEGRIENWPLQIRRCTACQGFEVRIVRQGRYIPSLRFGRRVFRVRPTLIEDEVIGYYNGPPEGEL